MERFSCVVCRVLRVIVYSLGFLVVVHFSADHTWVQMFYTTCHDFPGYIFFELSGIPDGFFVFAQLLWSGLDSDLLNSLGTFLRLRGRQMVQVQVQGPGSRNYTSNAGTSSRTATDAAALVFAWSASATNTTASGFCPRIRVPLELPRVLGPVAARRTRSDSGRYWHGAGVPGRRPGQPKTGWPATVLLAGCG